MAPCLAPLQPERVSVASPAGSSRTVVALAALACELALSRSPAAAQSSAPPSPPGVAAFEPGHVEYLIPGTVKDLTRDGAGRILYCTAEKDNGGIDECADADLAELEGRGQWHPELE